MVAVLYVERPDHLCRRILERGAHNGGARLVIVIRRTSKTVMEKVTISRLKKGDLFRMSASESAPLWVRGEYDRGSREYSAYKYDDVNHERFMKGGREVWQA